MPVLVAGFFCKDNTLGALFFHPRSVSDQSPTPEEGDLGGG